MNLALQNKLALVTGSSRGIGAAIAKHLAQDGAAVLVHYSVSRGRAEGVANEIQKAGGSAEIVRAPTKSIITLLPDLDLCEINRTRV